MMFLELDDQDAAELQAALAIAIDQERTFQRQARALGQRPGNARLTHLQGLFQQLTCRRAAA
jgi:hypothetical protein